MITIVKNAVNQGSRLVQKGNYNR